jgi:photosystem II stability/assembly factor-like uncharacterized protein
MGEALVAVGFDGIFYSTDGGTSWRKRQEVRTHYGREKLGAATFVTSQAGWAVGEDSTILYTGDGGKTWSAQSNQYGFNYYRVNFTDEKTGCAVGKDINNTTGVLFCTSDAGSHWSKVTLPQKQVEMSSLQFSNFGIGPPTIQVQVQVPVSNAQFLDQRFGWAAGENTIFHTIDGAKDWEPQFTDPDVTWYDIRFLPISGWSLIGSRQGHAEILGYAGEDRDTSNPHPISGWAVGGSSQGAPTILRYVAESGWVKARVNGSPDSLPERFNAVSFADQQSGWAVGPKGAIFHTSDGGENWYPQSSRVDVELRSVAFADNRSGWAVGDAGTILHTSDGGARWTAQASVANLAAALRSYRRWPAPIFWILIACSIPLLLRSAAAEPKRSRTRIEELISTDSPVVDVEDDRLGYRVLVERLTSFISNPNTTPPLVISLQAPWGMGKTSVMRMLQSNLRRNRAAVTVWFNAWHHQREDQIFAYLLETIQKEAVPAWLTPVGLRFRVKLLFRRLSGKSDRLALVVIATALLILRLFGAIPSQTALQRWLSLGPALLLGGLIWRSLVVFKSSPEKLVERSGGFLGQTVRELVSLPSLVGRTDVRQIFAENFRDVVEVLKPQRLVIFLDDLDRCRPDQVLQTLEAVNFLSSAAECMIILGADYQKVEALAAIQYEAVAVREEENRGGQDVPGRAVAVSLAYARDYLKKIVNLRLNLRLPAPSEFKQMLQEPSLMPTRERSIPRVTIAAVLLATVLGATWIADFLSNRSPVNSSQVLPMNSSSATPGAPQPQAGGTPLEDAERAERETKRDYISAGENQWPWIFGPVAFALLVGLLFWRSRPRHLEKAQDTQSFGQALERHVARICSRCESPREIRRFLNYLRLVATGGGSEQAEDISILRKKYGGVVDQLLVDLATAGREEGAGPEASAVQEYYRRQCDLFGLDPETFSPAERSAASRG